MNLATLPWYDLPEITAATDALWRSVARQLRRHGLRDVPGVLNRHIPYERQWTSSELLFGQACGYDVLIAYPERLRLVATPAYMAAGCGPSTYCSLVVVCEDAPYRVMEDLRGARCVLNTPTSHSGTNVLRALVAPLHRDGRFFARVEMSGAHDKSLAMILGGEADVAAIDCVTWALLGRHRPRAIAGTRVLCQTDPVPAPPYVTSARMPDHRLDRIRAALIEALEEPALRDVKADLLIDHVAVLPLEAYEPIARLEAMAIDLGYHEIAPLLAARPACPVRPM
jgi:ABC-type phosphate/phosphonate transport system substrate-binding protein